MLSCPTILENAIVPESYARVHYSQVKDITVSSAFCQLSLSLHYIYIYIYIYIVLSLGVLGQLLCTQPWHASAAAEAVQQQQSLLRQLYTMASEMTRSRQVFGQNSCIARMH